MRVSEDRYIRDLRRIHLAQRLVRHEVRTATIRLWTGLTDERVRNLHRSYDPRFGDGRRHRGPAPRDITDFLRQTPLRSEASAMMAFAHLYGVIPPRRLTDARQELPSVTAGERLCRAYEIYRHQIRDARLTLEQSMLLASALAEGVDIRLGHCAHCRGALLLDPHNLARDRCFWCKEHLADDAEDTSSESPTGQEATEGGQSPSGGIQQLLF